MMLQYSLDRKQEATAIEKAIAEALDEGARTADIAVEGEAVLSTTEMGELIVSKVNKRLS